uniref:Uncharacterized protein n=1 Tax=Anguilla anguilla TaxID=7936 RepID=A0A0E9PJ43_ANGAN
MKVAVIEWLIFKPFPDS